MSTKRPYELLPLPHPKDFDPGQKYFYENFTKPLVKDFIRVMCTGITIDPDAVKKLTDEVDVILQQVDDRLAKNPIIAKFQKLRGRENQKDYEAECLKSIRTIKDYIKPYNPKDIIHRTWVVNTYLAGTEEPREKWSVADLKKYNVFKKDNFIKSVIDGNVSEKAASEGMLALAQFKLDLWNRPRIEKSKKKAPLENFNPGSAQQKQKLFEMLGIESTNKSDKTGNDSWDRDSIELLMKTTSNPDLIDILESFIDHSFGAIIKSNFLAAFDRFTINGVLHGNIKLFGAKTFRPTSNSPNMLNMPSTKSIYAKPLKRCFVAPPGKIVYAIDESALEDRVIANLTNDTNKKNVFLEGLDGHSLNACGYFPERVKDAIGSYDTVVDTVKAFMDQHKKENKIVEAIRQESKGPTFKLAYGGYPDAHKGGVITQEIFDNYHNVLYPGITEYRENYVFKTAKENGYIHLGLGCRLYTSDAGGDIRTLHNATVQFWSILTLIAINEIHHRADQNGLSSAIEVCATIYDSIYFIVDEDPEIVKWLNDNIVEIMCMQYLTEEPIRNEAAGEIGRNFADLHKVKNGASLNEIKEILNAIDA